MTRENVLGLRNEGGDALSVIIKGRFRPSLPAGLRIWHPHPASNKINQDTQPKPNKPTPNSAKDQDQTDQNSARQTYTNNSVFVYTIATTPRRHRRSQCVAIAAGGPGRGVDFAEARLLAVTLVILSEHSGRCAPVRSTAAGSRGAGSTELCRCG